MGRYYYATLNFFDKLSNSSAMLDRFWLVEEISSITEDCSSVVEARL
ncbi:hypothetical protein [Desulfallas thermosapovorans]|uniref:Uncharacterized protein n=1 Tax=Desulfallas thermosapovorans DSM 6562 TaxID=1121431 RepID=A0A5S4ZT14_9FIRM|nr:hypothetical protein [Desulfallas thermosapovorans]TYO95987.1 hypothetical protein LX24_01377 [Desulfallas thermosapovorans DSM 6562]